MSAYPSRADMLQDLDQCPLSAINRHSLRSEEPYQLTRIPALPLTPEMSSASTLANTAVVGTAPSTTSGRRSAEIKAVKRKAALTMAGGKYQEQLKRPWRTFR